MFQERIYACSLLEKLCFPQTAPSVLEDNTTCTKWAGGAFSGTDLAKHIGLREHFVHKAQSNKILQLEPVDSAKNHQAAAQGHVLALEKAHHGPLKVLVFLTQHNLAFSENFHVDLF